MKIAKIKDWLISNSKNLWRWVITHKLKTLLYLTVAFFSSILLLVLLTWLGAFGRLPSVDSLKHIKNPIASTIYGSNGDVLGNFYTQNRSNIDSAEVNEHIKNALIAVEDIRFYDHNGIDYRSLGRVLVKSILLSDESSGGGSTITQQLAKNLFGRQNTFLIGMPVNKLREMMIARRMEKVYTKDEILLLYLNTVMFGENLYGLEKVAHRYFNKKPPQLNLEESALLVGLLQAPNAYNPRKNPERAITRRNIVLSQMYKYGKIDEVTYLAAKDKKLELKYQQPPNLASFAAYYKMYLRKEFEAWAVNNPKSDGTLYDVNIDGLKIYTSLHPSIQRSAEKAMQSHLARLQQQFDKDWDTQPAGMHRDSFLVKVMLQDSYIKELQEKGKKDSEIRQQFHKTGDKRIWTWENGFTTVPMTFRNYIAHELTRLHTGILVLDNRTGKIMAYVGGNDYNFSQYDQIQIPRQVGSTFKPIVYLSGLFSGLSPCDFYDNQLKTYSQYEGWTPRNSNGKYGGSYSMWGALANSVNTVSAEVMLKTGTSRVMSLANRMGIQSELPKVPSIVLGTADISLMDMAKAYAFIANGGGTVQPFSILKIEDENGKVLYEAKYNFVNRKEVPESFQNVQKMMRAVITEGTGSRFNNYQIPFNVIGKTGTTQHNSDGWFMASSPEVTIGAWVGTLDRRVHFKSTYLGSGANTSLPMVSRIFADLSMWKKPLISNFEYTVDEFDCVSYSELAAEEAKLIRPLSDTLKINTDSLQLEPDSIPLEQNIQDEVSPDSSSEGDFSE
ncbi:MAG: transglycosylase domain-containing protein [Bacteroidetes bacterium]|nr:transglycosylase domain-containing protein [Bacteroidota bacterium]